MKQNVLGGVYVAPRDAYAHSRHATPEQGSNTYFDIAGNMHCLRSP